MVRVGHWTLKQAFDTGEALSALAPESRQTVLPDATPHAGHDGES